MQIISSSRAIKTWRQQLALFVLLFVSKCDAFLLSAQRQPSFCSGTELSLSQNSVEESARMALQRTADHLKRLQRQRAPLQLQPDQPQDPLSLERERLYLSYIQQSANSLKELLKQRRLSNKGNKPDLARRLVAYDLQQQYGNDDDMAFLESKQADSYAQDKLIGDGRIEQEAQRVASVAGLKKPVLFGGLALSQAASTALARAGFSRPTPIQREAIPSLVKGESIILHAETGSGKTLTYLLPITEALWNSFDDSDQPSLAVVLLPTRELAAQVAGVAMELAPPGSVRLISRPMNLARLARNDREMDPNATDRQNKPRLLISSAKMFMISLYGDQNVMPAPPTTKPEAMAVLKSVKVCVLDEVDRLLGVVGGATGGNSGPAMAGDSKGRKNKARLHEKPAAVVAAAIMRHTLGRAQVVAASATVGRSLRRELSRVMGLLPQECPPTIVGVSNGDEQEEEEKTIEAQLELEAEEETKATGHVGRAVTIPKTVKHYIVSVDGSSDGELLTGAYKVIRSLNDAKPCRCLMVLSRGFGISTTNTIGALKHFNCEPEPISLLDALEADDTWERIEKHRQVSGASGVGQSSSSSSSSYFDPKTQQGKSSGYLLITGEDTVRGLHLDGLEVVIVLGRPKGPDEYCHIAGRTGRSGASGVVINIVSGGNAASLVSWGRMLECDFQSLVVDQSGSLL